MNRTNCLALAAALVLSACCAEPLQFWDSKLNSEGKEVALASEDLQIRTMEKAQAEKDARYAFNRGDFRFIGDRLVNPRFFGVANDVWLRKSTTEHGFKVIAASERLRDDERFRTMCVHYQDAYNRELLLLMRRVQSGN